MNICSTWLSQFIEAENLIFKCTDVQRYLATFPRNSIDISADASKQNFEMADSPMDKLQSAIEDILRTCSTDEITRIATILKISDEDLEGKGQRRILRLIGNIIDEFANDEKLAIFEGIAK